MQYLNVDHLRRCMKTLDSSLVFYRAAEDEIEQEVFRNAIIKGYELTQETAFKLLKKALKHFGHGGKKLESMIVKEVLRLAATHDLMTLDEVSRWFRYRDNRNSTAHDYGEKFADETLTLIPEFLADIETLANVLDRKLGKEAQNVSD